MARRPRSEAPGAVHHAVAQGSGRRRIVFDDTDRIAFQLRYRRLQRELGWIVHSSCLMDTHHHGVVETKQPNLGIGMGRLQGSHARWLNERRGEEGHVFRNRFWSRPILDDAGLLRACLYVVLNPVSAGLCAHPRDWRWCSYRATAEGDPEMYAPGEERLLGLFGDSPREARRNYARVVAECSEQIRAARMGGAGALWAALGELPPRSSSGVPG